MKTFRQQMVVALFGAASLVAFAASPAVAAKEAAGQGAAAQEGTSASVAFHSFVSGLMQKRPLVAGANANPWGDLSLDALQRQDTQDQGRLAALRAIDRAQLAAADQLQYDRIAYAIEQKIGVYQNHVFAFTPNARNGIRFAAQEAERMRFATVPDYEAWIRRLNAFDGHMNQYIARMRAAVDLGLAQPREVMVRIQPQISAQIVADPTQSLFYKPFTHMPTAISAADQQRLKADAQQAIRQVVVPAYQKLLDYYTHDYLPHTRSQAGLSSARNGAAIYAFLARYYTTTDLKPDEIHKIGLDKVAQIKARMEAVMKATGFSGSYAEFLTHLRTAPELFYKTGDEMLEGYQAAAKRVDPLLVTMFPVSLLPRMPYGVRGIAGGTKDDTIFAYAVPPAADGSVAGYMGINLAKATLRSSIDTQVLTCHEARPGHQLEIPIAMEVMKSGRFRLYGQNTAFIEGWALYAETLCDEMGLYRDNYERFAYLNYQMWRAVRLVIDTGIHTMGWTRQQAIDYFQANSSLDMDQITNEVDRYITNPGQALAYMIGETTIEELRARAEKALGPRFDVKAFHCAVLRNGELPLRLLSREVNAWIDTAAGQPADGQAGSPCRAAPPDGG